MNKAKSIGFCAVGWFAACFSMASGQDLNVNHPPVTLKFQWVPGKTYLQKMSLDQSLVIPMGAAKVNQAMKMTAETVMKVTATGGAGGKEIEAKHERIRMEMEMGGQKMAYDSAKPEDQTSPFAAVGGIVGKPFVLVVDEKNHVQAVKGLDEMSKALGANPAAMKMMKQFQDKDAMDQLMNTWISQTLPNRPVKAGDQWPFDANMKLGEMGKFRMVGTYHFKGFAPCDGVDCAVLDMEGKMDVALTAPGKDDAGNPLAAMMPKFKDGVIKGRIYWDNDLGWMRGMEMQQKLSMSMKNPMDGAEMSIPMDQKIHTTVTTK